VLPESKTVDNPDDISFIVRVPFLQTRQNASLNQPLFMQTFLVLKYFECYWLIMLVIVTMENLAERALSNLLLDFVSVVNMVFRIRDIFILFCVETVVVLRWLGGAGDWHSFFTRNVYVVNCLVFRNLLPLVFTQKLRIAS
jgi:hypothetical protein